MEMPERTWTQDQSIAYESACDGVSHVISHLQAKVYSTTDQSEAEALRAEVTRWWERRARLKVWDADEVAQLRADVASTLASYRAGRA